MQSFQFTSVAVRFSTISVLKSSCPCSLVLGDGRVRSVPDSIASHGALGPLPAIRPSTTPLDPETVPLALHPLPGEIAAVRPRVDAARLEPGLPGSGVLALLVGPRADAVPVSATLVRSTAVRASVVEVEMTDGGRCRSLVGRASSDGGRVVTGAGCSAHYPLTDHIDGVLGTLTAGDQTAHRMGPQIWSWTPMCLKEKRKNRENNTESVVSENSAPTRAPIFDSTCGRPPPTSASADERLQSSYCLLMNRR